MTSLAGKRLAAASTRVPNAFLLCESGIRKHGSTNRVCTVGVIGTRRALAQVSKTFNSPIDRTWAIWSSFGAAQLYIDGCSSARLEGYGVGATRALAFGGCAEMRETLRYIDPGSHTFAYTIEDTPGLPARGSMGVVSLQRRGDQQTEITWKGFAEEVTPGAEAGLSEQLVKLYIGSIEKARQTLET